MVGRQGGHTGKKASSAVITHLQSHRKALGLDKQQAEPPKQLTIPASACCLMADVTVGDNGETPRPLLSRSSHARTIRSIYPVLMLLYSTISAECRPAPRGY